MLGRGIKKTPFIMQMEAVECGAAALAIVLGYYGRFVPLAKLRVECGVSRDGSKASNVVKAARRFGLKAKGFSKGLDAIQEVRLPCIVYWEFNHFLVVEGFSKKYVYLNDPAVGHRKLTHEEFDEGYTGVALVFEPGPDFVKEGRLPSPFPALWQRMKGSRKALIFATLAGLIGVAPGIAQAAITRILVDSVIVDGRFDWLRPILVGMLAIVAFQFCLNYLSGNFFRRLKNGLGAKLHAEFYQHLLRLPYQFYSQRYTGEVVDRSQLNDMIVGLLSGQLTSTIVGLIQMVLFGLVLLAYDVQLTLVGVLSTLLNFAFMRSVATRRMETNMRIARESGKVQGATVAAIQSIDSIQASGLEDSFFVKWKGMFAGVSNSQLDLAIESRYFSALPTITGSIIQTVTLLLGGFRIMNGDMTFGTLMAFNSLMGMFIQPLNSLLGLGVQMQQIRGNVIRLEDVMSHPTRKMGSPPKVIETDQTASKSDKAERNGTADAVESRLQGNIVCKGLEFGYSPLDGALIQRFELELKPGERAALVGGSGSGKSTVAKIVSGLLVPWKGEVLFDGKSREEIPNDLLTTSCATIDQDILLFPGTVRENLTLWDETVPEQWVIEACEDADILDAIMAMPGGLDANVAEGGSNLSGGQRQRLEIARALVRRPSILIMDEATSALDVQTELVVSRNIRRRGITCLIVAHRLSTIRDCHTILVMDRGKVREQGRHDELWERGKFYAKLLKDQDSEVAS